MHKPTVIVMAGLPGVGKSTIARELAKALNLFHLRVDAIERPFLDKGTQLTSEGYEAIAALATENLNLGQGCIIDCVNPWPLTRAMFAFEAVPCRVMKVEVLCSNETAHRDRLAARGTGPAFEEIGDRGYERWLDAEVCVDTASSSVEEAVALVIRLIM